MNKINIISGANGVFLNDGELVGGIYSDIPFSVYKQIKALNHSRLKSSFTSMAHFNYEQNNPADVEIYNRQLTGGSLTHALALTPKEVNNHFFLFPSPEDYPNALHTLSDLQGYLVKHLQTCPSTKSGCVDLVREIDPDAYIFDYIVEKSLRAGWGDKAFNHAMGLASNRISSVISKHSEPSVRRMANKMGVTKSDWDLCLRCANSVITHPRVARYLKNGKAELTLIAYDSNHEMWLKCRLDWLYDSSVPLDLKTTSGTGTYDFKKACLRYNYDTQEAFYLHVAALLGIELAPMEFIAVETALPNLVTPYGLDSVCRERAKGIVISHLSKIQQSMLTGKWDAYSVGDELVTLKLNRKSGVFTQSDVSSFANYF